MGPRPFAQADEKRFFGRDREAAELYSLVAAHRTVLLYAQSGAGKTSLLNAGVIPVLTERGFDVLPPARVSRPSGVRGPRDRVDNVYVLNLALAWAPPNAMGEEENLTNATLVDVLGNRPRSEGADGVPLPRVLVFDQFEELFTAHQERWRDRRGFFVQLDDAMSADPSLRVLFAMREDFVAHIDPYEDLLPEEFRTRYRLEQLREEAALVAVERPLERTGIRFKPGVAELLVEDLLRSPYTSAEHTASGERATPSEQPIAGACLACEFVEPVQLQVVCFNLFRSLPERTTEITPEHLAAFGNVDQALQEFYQSALKEAAEKANTNEDSLRQWFETKLITEAGTRGLVFRGETAAGGIPCPAVDALEELHIIRAEVRGKDRWYELSHDRFVQPVLRANDAWRARAQEAARRRQEEESRRQLEAERAEAERARQQAKEQARQAKRFFRLSLALGGVLLVALAAIVYAFIEKALAKDNFRQALNAVDEMLMSAGRQQARVVADVPEMEEFRQQLLDKAKGFYLGFAKQKTHDEELRHRIARAHFSIGDIYRLLDNPGEAVKEYREAIAQFQSLTADYPRKPEYRQELANSYNWLGETLRPLREGRADAGQAYNSALGIQQDLLDGNPKNAEYKRELARTHYNRGILRFDSGDLNDSDFREAIRLLEPLAEKETAAAQELARAYGDLGVLLAQKGDLSEAQEYYERAIAIHDGLTKKQPGNREYKLELATFCDNLAIVLQEQEKFDLASQRNKQALDLTEELVRPPVSLAVELANAHNYRGQILDAQGSREEAGNEYQKSLDIFEKLEKAQSSRDLHALHHELHLRFGNALYNLAALREEDRDLEGARLLLLRAVSQHSQAGSRAELAWDYLELARSSLASGMLADAQTALERGSRLLAGLPEPDKSYASESYQELRDKITKHKTRQKGTLVTKEGE